MTEKHINDLTMSDIDYAVVNAQGWWNHIINGKVQIYIKETGLIPYHPTTNQHQCGELIDKFKIATKWNGTHWTSESYGKNIAIEDSRLVAVCKSYLLSVYPDGVIPCA